ncbi:hypothetical protein, partial [Pseudohoeflea coraliihabitans]
IASDGLTRVDIPSGADWQVGGTWDGSAYSDPPGHADKVQAKRRAGVNAERTRRLLAGKAFNVTGYGTVHPDGSIATQTILNRQAAKAKAMQADNDASASLVFRDVQNVIHQLTPSQMLELVDLGSAWVEATYKASWDIKDMNPIPADYADVKRWP